ncbi:hypothetical protein EDC04DRAFT_2611221 [Pisolithus marmoratus]|nr:hypothetical protein EDC04DRAFT_2611221 [Pisolithus marmoratus]
MSHVKLSPNLPVKIGPPISVQRSQRNKGNTMQPTKVQPVKSCHQRIKEIRIPPMETRLKWRMNPAQSLGIQPSSCVWCNILHKYLNSFCTKMVTLSNGQQLHPHVALQQLHAGVISKEDIVQDDDSDEGKNIPESSPAPSTDKHTPPDGDMDSETEEQVVKDVMEPVDEGNSVMDDQGNNTPDGSIRHEGSTESSDKHSDWSADKRCSLKLEQTRQEIHNGNYDFDHHPSTPPLEFPASSEDEDAIADIEDNSQKTKRKYAHPLTDVSQATSRTVDEGVDTDDAGGTEERSLNLKCGRLPMEAIHQAQALGMCTTQEAQAIADKYRKTLISIMTAAGLTSKATWAESAWNMHQAWYVHTNPKASREHMKDYYSHQMKHYKDHKDEEEFPQLWAEICMFWSESISGSKDTSSKAMAQTWCNVEGIHVFGCVIYSGSDEAACQAQGIFAGSTLCMQLAGEKQMDISKLLDYLATIVKNPEEANLVGGQRNVPWKTLLDVLYTAQYTVVDWPAHIPAVGPDFNIRHLNANELHGLVVPFLKEQMGADYHAEAPGEDEDQDGFMVVPSSSFDLKKWTPGIPQSTSERCTSSQESIDVIPPSLLTTRGVTTALTIEPLTFTTNTPIVIPPHHALSIMHANITGNIGSMRVIMMHPHHREGTIIVLLNMYIETIPASGTMAMIWMMKTITDIIAMQATKYPDDTATIGF